MKKMASLLLSFVMLTSLVIPVCATEATTETQGQTDSTICSHNWTAGEVKEATCIAAGEKNFTCNLCGETKKETIEILAHNFGSPQKVDENKHKSICSGCNSEQEAAHIWAEGELITPATCIVTGSRKLTCVCGAAGTKVEPLSAHTYDNDCDTSCNVCNASRTIEHTYDNVCDKDCNVCGATRTTSHAYGSSWSRDHSCHWHECTKCGEKKDFRSHYPGPAATEDQPQLCLTCDYVITAQKQHQHSYAKKWSQDDSGHWYTCAACDVKKDVGQHVYDSVCDTDCNICDYENLSAHDYGDSWENNEKRHWSVCKVCKNKTEAELHVPGPEATETQAQLCTVCGYEIVPIQEHVHAFGPAWMYDGKTHWQACVCGEQTVPAEHTWDDGTKNKDKTVTYLCTQCQAEKTEEASGFPWWILIFLLILAAGGGAAAYVFYIVPQKQSGKFVS